MEQTKSEVISEELNSLLGDDGFELYQFKISWYNDVVKPVFRLPYDPDTLCLVVLNTPLMFEKAFLPYLKKGLWNKQNDPIDQCMVYYMSKVKEKYGDLAVEIIHEFELTPNRRPKILAQTACHVSGAAYYYQRCDVPEEMWSTTQKIYGVSIHPRYGGWFAIRALVILKEVLTPNLPRRYPLDVVPKTEDRIDLLEQFNMHWEDWTYRDIIPVEKKYSAMQNSRNRHILTKNLSVKGFITKGKCRLAACGFAATVHVESTIALLLPRDVAGWFRLINSVFKLNS